MLSLKIPATTANMGPGFDSIGMALQLYNNILIEEIESGLEIEIKNEGSFYIPRDETNLIYKTIDDFFKMIGKKTPGLKIIQEDNIPLTRGLGSSAACIVAGLMAANKLSNANISKREMAELAAKIEEHPDNSTPAIYGGMVIGAMENEKLEFIKIDVPKELTFNVMIPSFTLSTETARKVVPNNITLKDAIYNSSRTALLVASIMNKDFDKLETAMNDRFHQQYRMPIIPNMENIFKKSKEFGAKGVFLSGAGPTLIAITKDNNKFYDVMNEFLKSLDGEWNIYLLKPDSNGASISII